MKDKFYSNCCFFVGEYWYWKVVIIFMQYHKVFLKYVQEIINMNEKSHFDQNLKLGPYI